MNTETKQNLPVTTEPIVPQQIDLYKDPGSVLAEARNAAMKLKEIISAKPKKVEFNGEQYLEFEDWQTIGRFYGISAKVLSVEPVILGEVKGFKAKAGAFNPAGIEVSAAEAVCMSDEKSWKYKPLFQLMSMAQTRACAKAMRNVLAWVTVLAGFKPTPAEEMGEVIANGSSKPPAQQAQAKSDDFAEGFENEPLPPDPWATDEKPKAASPKQQTGTATKAQRNLIYAKSKNKNLSNEQFKNLLIKTVGKSSTNELDWQDINPLVKALAAYILPSQAGKEA